ncbi:MAG: hypothetical protein FWG11_06550, partial [Promicromonosporaceae bacterium]|nr:hypothetical protein [Promicromonosporaceae bacterium]
VPVMAAVRGAVEPIIVQSLSQCAEVTLTRRCSDAVELLACAAAGVAQVALLSADFRGISLDLMASLRASQVGIIMVAPSSQEASPLAAHADLTIDDEDAADPAALATAIGQGATTAVTPAAAEGHADNRAPQGRGRVITVWGPGGSPGRSTMALEIAAALAGMPPAEPPSAPRRPDGGRHRHDPSRRRGRRPRAAGRPKPTPRAGPESVLLIDADTYQASLAFRLGLLDESSGLAAACREAGRGALTPSGLRSLAALLTPDLALLTGLTRAVRWPEVSAVDLEEVCAQARHTVEWTVIDVAAPLEADEALLYDTAAPCRNAATRTALVQADHLVLVGGADPLGLVRLVKALADLGEAAVGQGPPAVVVLNRACAAHRLPRAAMQELWRYCGIGPEQIVMVPDAGPRQAAAVMAGRPLVAAARDTPAALACREVAERLRAGR